MTPKQFVKVWASTPLGEKQSYQSHFNDLCDMLGHAKPDASGYAENGSPFQFEWSLKKTSGGQGFADVFYGGHFAIEYKTPGKYKDFGDAYNQLLQYRENLNNPPLLIVTDIRNWEIHTNFPNTEKRVYRFTHGEIASDPEKLAWLRHMFDDPDRLNPGRNTEQITADAAKSFQIITDNMRGWNTDPTRIAFFATKLVFCLFAEDIGLLPRIRNTPTGIFTDVIKQSQGKPEVFKRHLQNLFNEMNRGGEFFGEDIKYFNGTLFSVVAVEELSLEAIEALAKAAALNWESIEPSIFGTLFERSLDPAKRSQLGAHYTSREDILLIIEPVLMQPLRYAWDTVQLEAAPVRERYDNPRDGRERVNAGNQLLQLRERILKRLRETTVLDPACGSGNFLYVALQELMDLEKEVINHELWDGLQMPLPAVHPRQMFGIEIAPIAHALASIVVWIGYIQWRIKNGYGRTFSEPILEKLQGNIVCKDAILALDEDGNPTAPEWPKVDVIIGNPPFLGDKLMRSELGDKYVDRLRDYYHGRVPGGADLVTYWFEKSREEIETDQVKRVGLLATNSIRIGTNRAVLKRIKNTGDVFMAWSDREWILEGASVRVSMIGFDNGSETKKILDGSVVSSINSDLTDSVDIVDAMPLSENQNLAFLGVLKSGPFDISAQDAEIMINANSINAEVVKPRLNGRDIANRSSNSWIIDFVDRSIQLAMAYEKPFSYIERVVKPVRETNKVKSLRERWWMHARPRYAMREATSSLERYIVTPEVTKYRIYIWIDKNTVPDHTLHAIARDDDYFFGVLHSSFHERWALRMGSTLGPTPRYNSSRTFETFPFPRSPGDEDESQPAHAAISAAAKQLHEERHAWLNPEDASAKELKDRTLTNLYNALQVWRGRDSMKTKAAARDFAPRLDELHRALDEAVCDAYGWAYEILDDEEEILRRLLALNLARAE